MTAAALVARVWGIDLDRLLGYLEDPGSFHDEVVDTEDAMP
jgi:hypothetical protein